MPIYAYLGVKLTIDNCVGQEVQLVKAERLFKTQKNTGQQKLIELANEYFKVKDEARCPIKMYDVLDEAEKVVAASSPLKSFLVLGEQTDITKLPLSYKTDIGSQLA